MLFFVFVSISLREGRNYTLEMAELGDENWGGLELKKRERKPKCLFSFLTTKKKKRTKKKRSRGKALALSRTLFDCKNDSNALCSPNDD